MTPITTKENLISMGISAQAASRKLSRLSDSVKVQVLNNIAQALESNHDSVIKANQTDFQQAKSEGMAEAMLDRLLLTPERLLATAKEVRNVAELVDPVGQIIETNTLPNGLIMEKKRVPLGVIGSIYESRPNVTVDIASLCIKSGNACLLRGGKESLYSNTALIHLIQRGIEESGLPIESEQFDNCPTHL